MARNNEIAKPEPSSPAIVPTILSGGLGSRLWPASRKQHPKPFMALPNGNSLIQEAFLRASQIDNISEILTVTNIDLLSKTAIEYDSINPTDIKTSFILEPFGRNTAAAIAVAALYLSHKLSKEVVMLILPADHVITDQDSFM